MNRLILMDSTQSQLQWHVCAAGYAVVKINKMIKDDRQKACKDKATTQEENDGCDKLKGPLEDPFYSSEKVQNE